MLDQVASAGLRHRHKYRAGRSSLDRTPSGIKGPRAWTCAQGSSLKEKWWYKITALREHFELLWNFQPAPVGTFKISSVPAAYRTPHGLLAQGNPGKYSVHLTVLPMCLWKGIYEKRAFSFFHLVLGEINPEPNKRGGQRELVFPLPENSAILPPPAQKIAVWLKSCQGSAK